MLKKDKKTVKKGRNLDLTHAPPHCWSENREFNHKPNQHRTHEYPKLQIHKPGKKDKLSKFIKSLGYPTELIFYRDS